MTAKQGGKRSKKVTVSLEKSTGLYFMNKAAVVTFVKDLLKRVNPNVTSLSITIIPQAKSVDYFALAATINYSDGTSTMMYIKPNA